MLLPAHLMTGLIVAKVTGDYPTAILAATLIDADHLISYYRRGIVFKPKKFLAATLNPKDPWKDQRNILHNLFSWLVISIGAVALNPAVGITLASGYFSHLLLDAIDSADFFPLFPIRRFNLKLPITYYSGRELIVTLVLISIYLLV